MGGGFCTSKSPTILTPTSGCSSSDRFGDYLPVPDASMQPPCQSPSCLSVPGTTYPGGASLSRRASSTTSSIFDLSYETEQLEKAIRENNVRIVKKILDVHCHRFHTSCTGSSSNIGGGVRNNTYTDPWSNTNSGTVSQRTHDASRKVSSDQSHVLLPDSALSGISNEASIKARLSINSNSYGSVKAMPIALVTTRRLSIVTELPLSLFLMNRFWP